MKTLSQSLTFPCEGKAITGYLAHPEGETKLPGVLVIHEVFGLNDNIREITDRFADEGYAALAVDLFSGGLKALCVAQTIGGAFGSKTDTRATRILRAALNYLSDQPFVEGTRVGAIGFCMGGNFAMALSYEEPRIQTIAPFYSTTPRGIKDFSKLCPTVGSFPGDDFTAKMGLQLQEKLTSAGVPNEITIYPGAGHSFMNNHAAKTYRPEAAAQAWDKTLAFFAEQLKK